jgi:hypothetical protein
VLSGATSNAASRARPFRKIRIAELADGNSCRVALIGKPGGVLLAVGGIVLLAALMRKFVPD